MIIKNLKEWVKSGGVLVRFADKKIVTQKDLYFDEKIYYQKKNGNRIFYAKHVVY